MTFAEVLPALAKGRIAHWKSWDYRLTPPGLEYRALGEEWQQLRDASNQDFYVDSTWEVVPEEPAKHVHFCGLECCARAASDRGTIAGLHGTITDLKGRIEENIDTIAHLERERDIREAGETEARRNWARDFVEGGKREGELRRQIDVLKGERDGLAVAYAELRAVAENNAAILDKVDAIVKAHS